jgi:mannosyl-3-phosphoglycerate phosphatase
MNSLPMVFTDMDGTLLDHSDYSFSAALPALQRLNKLNAPIIPNTSKTYVEMQVLREQIALTDFPFIIENGAAIYIPAGFFPKQPEKTQLKGDYWVKEFSPPIAHWHAIMKKLVADFADHYQMFSDMSLQQLMEVTDLSPQEAQRAATREYGEPLLWQGDEQTKARYIAQLRQFGANPLQGGRFLHVSGLCDKGMALHWLSKEFRAQFPQNSWISIALGDSNNDVAMLQAADIAVRIASPISKLPEVNQHSRLIDSQLKGPAGWDQCMQQILDQLEEAQ